MNICTKLYRNTLKNGAPPQSQILYKSYRNTLTKIKRKAKLDYYTKCSYTLKSNMKKLWRLINNVIGHTQDKSTIIVYITSSNIDFYGAEEVDNQLGKFYSELGATLAQSINSKYAMINEYLSKMHRNKKFLFLQPIAADEIKKYIDNCLLKIVQDMTT